MSSERPCDSACVDDLGKKQSDDVNSSAGSDTGRTLLRGDQRIDIALDDKSIVRETARAGLHSRAAEFRGATLLMY